ncbi:hypothetical protein PF010_g7758 [Phytophthora fragariae]|uniref:Uncharacterized protein n=1 Tax=Phytophthora fragariae TaxID=53985 RepID=A0A6G0S145_9STRA|nr:hypothetical protein PF010_g7758 [Phytophthora fragariae]KAE9346816.1 hypothetical protein PF008_g8103 [Phytophthora fragariae]
MSDRDMSTPAKKRIKVLDRIAGILEAQQRPDKDSVMSSSLEKACDVKEWALAIEILARVGDTSDSILAIRAAVDSVVQAAATELHNRVQQNGEDLGQGGEHLLQGDDQHGGDRQIGDHHHGNED